MNLDKLSSTQWDEQENTSGSESLSLENTRSGKTGSKLIDVLARAWASPFTTKSDFSREYADFVAMAASDGFITTRQAAGLYSNTWMITSLGLRHLETLGGFK